MIRLDMLACLLLTGCCCCPKAPVAFGTDPSTERLKWGNGRPITAPCAPGRVLTSNPPQYVGPDCLGPSAPKVIYP